MGVVLPPVPKPSSPPPPMPPSSVLPAGPSRRSDECGRMGDRSGRAVGVEVSVVVAVNGAAGAAGAAAAAGAHTAHGFKPRWNASATVTRTYRPLASDGSHERTW